MWQDNGAAHQAVAIDPFNITNVFLNYQLRGSSALQNTRIRFAVNNLTDSHAITAVTPASATSNAPAAGDILTLMSVRSVSQLCTLLGRSQQRHSRVLCVTSTLGCFA